LAEARPCAVKGGGSPTRDLPALQREPQPADATAPRREGGAGGQGAEGGGEASRGSSIRRPLRSGGRRRGPAHPAVGGGGQRRQRLRGEGCRDHVLVQRGALGPLVSGGGAPVPEA